MWSTTIVPEIPFFFIFKLMISKSAHFLLHSKKLCQRLCHGGLFYTRSESRKSFSSIISLSPALFSVTDHSWPKCTGFTKCEPITLHKEVPRPYDWINVGKPAFILTVSLSGYKLRNEVGFFSMHGKFLFNQLAKISFPVAWSIQIQFTPPLFGAGGLTQKDTGLAILSQSYRGTTSSGNLAGRNIRGLWRKSNFMFLESDGLIGIDEGNIHF